MPTATRTKGATILKLSELPKLYRTLPASWIQAAGLLRQRPVDPVEYQRSIRREWEERLRKLERESKNRHTGE